MGINLVPKINTSEMYIEEKDYFGRANDPFKDNPIKNTWSSVESGCIPEGHHRVLRFAVQSYNIGDTDLEIGDPMQHLTGQNPIFARREDLGLPNGPHPILFIEKFYLFNLRNDSGNVNLSGFKRPFCLADLVNYNCNKQGISKGGDLFDEYPSDLECQFIIIDGIADGEYTLEVLTNATSVLAVKKGIGKILFQEDNYDDNCIAVRLKIHGNDPPEILGPGTCRIDDFVH